MHIITSAWERRVRMLGALVVALAASLTIVNATSSPANAAACWVWNPATNGEGAAYANRDHLLRTWYTSSSCSSAYLSLGQNVYLHCYTYNEYGNKWWYVRIAGTNSYGWTSANNLNLYYHDDNNDGFMNLTVC